MFRQLYRRLCGIVLAVVLAVVLLTGGCLMVSSAAFYIEDFSASMEMAGSSDLTATIYTALTAEQDDTVTLAQLESAINRYAGTLSLNENRSAYILSARDASVIYPASLRPGTLAVTDNLSAAMRGGNGNEYSFFGDYLDGAIFIKNGDNPQDGFIFYVRDNKAELDRMGGITRAEETE